MASVKFNVRLVDDWVRDPVRRRETFFLYAPSLAQEQTSDPPTFFHQILSNNDSCGICPKNHIVGSVV